MNIVGRRTFSILAAALPLIEGAAAVCVPLSVQILELQLKNLVHHQSQMCNQGRGICIWACFKIAVSTVEIVL